MYSPLNSTPGKRFFSCKKCTITQASDEVLMGWLNSYFNELELGPKCNKCRYEEYKEKIDQILDSETPNTKDLGYLRTFIEHYENNTLTQYDKAVIR